MKERLQGWWLRLLCWTILQCARGLPYSQNEESLSGFWHNLHQYPDYSRRFSMPRSERREEIRKFSATWSTYAVLDAIDGPLRIWRQDALYRQVLAEEKLDPHSDVHERRVYDKARYIDWLQITEGGKRGWYCYLKALVK